MSCVVAFSRELVLPANNPPSAMRCSATGTAIRLRRRRTSATRTSPLRLRAVVPRLHPKAYEEMAGHCHELTRNSPERPGMLGGRVIERTIPRLVLSEEGRR